uniref:NADP-dependent oxidoreductase domain-containing protein n=1 Tax=Psilocybe cubensis TaxID=181762 RepID=A0A8H8CEZ4_PSICU
MSLPTRKIGNDDVTAMGFGLMGMSAFYGPIDSDEDRFKVLDAAFDAGCTNWDSANIYGDSEVLLGKWFKRTGKRKDLFIATKFGFTLQGPNNKPEYIRECCDSSLKKMGIETIDLYYCHRVDENIPIEDTVGHMAQLVKEGKVRYLGLSEVSGDTLRRAHAVHPISAVQIEYSPFCLDMELQTTGLKAACDELGVAIVAYSPLGRGLLTGTYKSNADIPADDFRKTVPKFSDKNFPNLLKLVACMENIGKKHKATAGQVCLAWILAQGNNIIPIPGTKRVKYLKENLESLNVKLSPEEIAEIRKTAEEADKHHLDRYPAEMMTALFANTVPKN